jgi:hypothetical protein
MQVQSYNVKVTETVGIVFAIRFFVCALLFHNFFLFIKTEHVFLNVYGSQEFDSKELIPPAYVAWQAGTITLLYSVPSPHRMFKIPAQVGFSLLLACGRKN